MTPVTPFFEAIYRETRKKTTLWVAFQPIWIISPTTLLVGIKNSDEKKIFETTTRLDFLALFWQFLVTFFLKPFFRPENVIRWQALKKMCRSISEPSKSPPASLAKNALPSSTSTRAWSLNICPTLKKKKLFFLEGFLNYCTNFHLTKKIKMKLSQQIYTKEKNMNFFTQSPTITLSTRLASPCVWRCWAVHNTDVPHAWR